MRHVLLLDIDGLRFDVFRRAYQAGQLPHISRILGPASDQNHFPLISTAPSITFCAQATIFTGKNPNEHGVLGNQFFDRFGDLQGKPRSFAFDVGDLLDFDDAVMVFADGLASDCLQVPTIYETLGERGLTSLVVGNMYAKGADKWIPPTLTNLARLTKAKSVIGISEPDYDDDLLARTKAWLADRPLPNVLTYYLKGLDGVSHYEGTGAQADYLIEEIDPHIGALWDFLSARYPDETAGMQVLLFSDHGQIDVVPDEQHSIRMAFPFQNEFKKLFDTLGFDLSDYPGEGPRSNAVVCLNAGLAYVYLRRGEADWGEPPDFAGDVVRVGQALWQASRTGAFGGGLRDALDSILVRDAASHGWEAGYQALTPEGELLPLAMWAEKQTQPAVYSLERLAALTGKFSGDLIVFSNYADGYYFCPVMKGVHGGLHPDESVGVLAAREARPVAAMREMLGRELFLRDVAGVVEWL
jgi:hypothetical protein